MAQLPFSVICIDLNGNIIDCNSLAEELTGYQSTEIIGQHIEQLIPDKVVTSYVSYRHNNSVTHSGSNKPAQRVVQLVNKAQNIIHCQMKVSGTDDYLLLFIEKSPYVDIALKNKADKTTQRLVGQIEEAFWEWNIEQGTLYHSAQLMALLGYEAKEFQCTTSFWEQHLASDDLQDVYHQVQQHFLGNIPCINPTYPVITKQGDKKWLTVLGKVFEYDKGKPLKMFGSVKDISESQKLIAQLKKQNSYLQLAEQLGNSGHWRIDLVNNKLYWSKGIYTIHGVHPKTYQPSIDSAIEFYVEEERSRIKLLVDNAIEEKHGFHFKSTLINAKGKKVKVESVGKVELDPDGKLLGIFGVFRDISQTEDMIEKLKLMAMVNYSIKVPIFFINENDNIVYQDLSPQVDSANAVLFNYINFSINDYMKYKRLAKEKGQIKYANISFDKYISVFDMSVTFEPEEEIYIWIVENVTEKYRQEQQQIISNRLALLGNTFGTVSHDINNVLGVALGATEMLELKVAQGNQDIGKYIERVKNAIDKGKDVTKRLLAFTRKPTVKMITFDPIKEIKDNKYLFEQLLLSTIEFSLNFDEIKCQIKFPQGEFINILLNLVLNAQDAIQEQGLIGKISIFVTLNADNLLEIHVQDSGIGIKQEDLSKIFDPFYSSKSVNKGNGLGLANVYSTMYKYNGEIRVEGHSELGGAEFILVLPCKILKQPPDIAKKTVATSTMDGKKVLVLDDEVSIGEYVALYLESIGAKTHYVGNKKALEAVLEGEQSFDIFITDMILPDISGRDAVALVKTKFPSIKVYSISGYIAEEDNMWQYPVLRKPFNSQELAAFLAKY